MTTRFEKLSLSQYKPARRGLRASELKVENPAVGTGTAKALQAVETVAQENQVGSHRPSTLLTALAPDKSRLYFMPVLASNDPDALSITYGKSEFEINLNPIFTMLERLVPKGIREVYAWESTKEHIEISGVTGKALYITLGSPKQEAIKQMSPEALAKRRATIARKKQAASTEPETDQN